MLPVCDVRGRVLGFGARKLGNARVPKYVNSPSGAMYCKSELLYGAHHARAVAAKTGIVIVVEGYIDALAMHQAGIVNTVALMGTSITEQQIGRLKQLAPTVVLMLDGDDAGAGAVLRAGVLARPLGLEVLVATLPEGTDPADLLQQREGAPIVRELVADAGAFARFRVQHHLERADIGTAEAKDRLIHELRDVFVDIQPSVVREDLISWVARHLELHPSLLSSWLSSPESRAGKGPTGGCPPPSPLKRPRHMEGTVAFSLTASPTPRSQRDSRRGTRWCGCFPMRCSDELPSTSECTRTILPRDSQTTTMLSRSSPAFSRRRSLARNDP